MTKSLGAKQAASGHRARDFPPHPLMSCRSLTALTLLTTVATATAVPLVGHSDTWRYRKGTSAPQSNWKTATDAALDATWLTGPGWIAYGDGTGANAAGTTLADMRMTTTPANAGYRTFYIRKTFTVPSGTPATEKVSLATATSTAALLPAPCGRPAPAASVLPWCSIIAAG